MELQVFNSTEFGSVRTATVNGEVMFVGKDVADILGYQNGSRDINRHVDEEDRHKVMFFDGNQDKETIIINESGLYSLILSSKMPNAKKFKHWVTAEVLPAIRKHGMYAIDEILENPDLVIAALTQLKEERERRKQLECQTLVQRQQIAEMQPKASYYDLILQNKNTVPITQIAMREFHLTSMHSTPMVIRVLLVVLATFRRLETENPLVVAALQLMISAQRKMTISYLNLNQPFNFRQAV